MRAASVPRIALVIFAIAVTLGPRLVSAEAPTINQVLIAPSTCPESLVTREVNAALRIELAAMGVIGTLCAPDDSCEPAEVGAMVGVELEGCVLREGPVLVWVESASGDRSERRVPLDDILPPARVRAVALTAVELLRAHQSWELESTRDPAATQTSEPSNDQPADQLSDFDDEQSDEEPAEDAGENPEPLPTPEYSSHTMERGFSSLLWDVALTGTGFSHGGPAHIGIRGGVAIHLGSRGPFWLLADVGLMYSGHDDELGRIDALTTTVAVSFAYGAQVGRAILMAGPRVEAGWTQGFGRSERADVSSVNHGAVVSMISAEVRVVFRLLRSFGLSVAVDAGAVLTSVDLMSAGRSLVAIDGAIIRALLGFCL